MKLSFIVPVYNSEKYLDGCISSLYRQNMDECEYEIICINDCSTDDSLKILKKYQEEHNNIIIENHSVNRGISCARNTGIEKAKGDYIRFVDSDDYIADDAVKILLDIASTNKIDMLYTLTTRTDNENLFEQSHADYSVEHLEILNGKDYFVKNNTPNGVWEYFISRKFLIDNQIRFVEGRMCEDGMFTLCCLNIATSVCKFNVDFYRYVVRPNSITTGKSSEHQKRMVDDFANAITFINNIILDENSKSTDINYIRKLIERRNSYFFYFQIRMLRAKTSIKVIKYYLDMFQKNGCYPNNGLTQDYYIIHRILSKIFQHKYCYLILCKLCSIVKKG